MSRKHLRIADVGVLAVFMALTFFINFFHTEKTFEAAPGCPACQFQHSSIATHVMPCLFVPRFDFVELVKASIVIRTEHLLFIDLSPRGPPQA